MDRQPIAVLISDIHFTVNTLEEAATSFLRAQFRAKMLDVPLVVAGDTLDSKAVMRAECVNRLLQLVSVKDAPEMIFLVGNHDLCNEKGREHSLNFLKPYATIVETPQYGMFGMYEVALIPYQADKQRIIDFLKFDAYHDATDEENEYFHVQHKKIMVIMHQGLNGSASGEYFQDRTALNKEDLAGWRVISGHYHARQTIELPEGGKFDYIGNPYSLGFGEANDPEKGYQILYSDGSLEFVPTQLRKHIIIEDNLATGEYKWSFGPGYATADRKDIFWVKIKAPSDVLSTFDKNEWAKDRGVPKNFRLDLIPTEAVISPTEEAKPQTQTEIMDNLIDGIINTNSERKERLKSLYKGLIS